MQNNLGITRKTIVDQIVESMIHSVASGRFPIGTKLPSEYELMEELRVSRNSLREAVKTLVSMGILEIKRGDGTYVCGQMNPSALDTLVYGMIFDLSTSRELVELRETFDQVIVRMAISKATGDDLDRLQSNIDEFRECIRTRDYKNAARLDYEFHTKLIEIMDNVFLRRIIRGVYQLFVHSIEKNIETEENFALADVYHQAMLDCIRNRDESAVAKVVSDSLTSWKKNLQSETRD